MVVPQDFPAYRKDGRPILFLFFCPGWIEWISATDGIPQRIGAREIGNSESCLASFLRGDLLRPQRIEAWCPAVMRQMVEGLLGLGELSTFPSVVNNYEDRAEALVRDGANSFGPRSKTRRNMLRWLSALLICLDIGLAGLILSRGIVEGERKCGELERERAKLSIAMGESVKLKAEIAEETRLNEVSRAGAAGPYSVIEGLARYLPANVELLSAEVENLGFRVTGTSENAYNLVSALEKTGFFTDLSLEQVSPLPDGKRSKFSLLGSLAHD
jgi:hypothetical protein